MNQLKLLWSLQQLDAELNQLHSQKAELNPGNIKDMGFKQLQAEQKVMEQKIREQQKNLRQKEMDLQKITQEKISLYDALYGESLSSGRELEQLEKKYHKVLEEKEKFEEKIIEQMEEVENMMGQLSLKKQEIEEKNRENHEYTKKIEKEISRLEKKIKVFEAERKLLVEQISPDLISKYNFMSKKYNGEGIALLHDGLCEGCRMFQPSSIVDRVNIPGMMVYCESCGRLLTKNE